MISYDDLVVALASWRAKQGLPVGAPAAVPAGASGAGSGGVSTGAPATAATASNSSGRRAAPPVAPPAPAAARPAPPTAAPAPLPLPAETIDVDDALDLHEHEAQDDLAALEPVEAFDAAHEGDGEESTSIGAAPAARDSFGGLTDPSDKRRW